MDRTLIAGRYRRRERLGAGGMASVWGARDERTGRDVAVKVLHPHLADDDRQRGRLRQEAHALASIDDLHVVPILDVVDDDGVAAIVMPRIEGQTLADRLGAEGTLPEGEALAIASAVAEALAAAHAVGLIHRDVKPSNILLGSDGVVRLMDFGIAADLDATTELTADGVVGTLRYLAPERLLGEPAVPATDVWGLGVVLLEMLSGRPAYPGGSLGERLAAAGDPIARPGGVSEPTWSVIRRAADGDPVRRYPDGAALSAALHEARSSSKIASDADDPTAVVAVASSHEGPEPRAASSPEPIPEAALVAARRPPALVAAVLAVLLLAGAGLAVVAVDPGPGATSGGDAPAVAPIASDPPTSTPAPDPTAAPAAAEDGDDDDDGGGEPKDKGGGNGNGKGKGKDKP